MLLPASLSDCRFAARVEVLKDGKEVESLTRNIGFQGSFVFPIPLALNKAKGDYQVRVTEVVTGSTQTLSFNVK